MTTRFVPLPDRDRRIAVAGRRRREQTLWRRFSKSAVPEPLVPCRGRWPVLALALGLTMVGGPDAAAQDHGPLRASFQGADQGSAPLADDIPFESQPYRIRVLFVFDDQATFTSHFRRWLVDHTAELIRRTVGDPWQGEVLEVGRQLGPLLSEAVGSPDEEFPQTFANDVDKVFLVRIAAGAVHYQLTAREYDVATGQWGPVRRRTSAIRNLLDREVLQVCLAIFAPLAEPAARPQPGRVQLTLKGGALLTADPTVRLVEPDAVFGLVRLFREDGAEQAQTVDWTYLVVQSTDVATLECRILSAYRNPTTGRAPGSRLLALRQRPGPTRASLRFLNRDGSPLSGYEVHVTDLHSATHAQRLTTDLQGALTLPSADTLLSVALRSGSQTLVRLWVLPGAMRGQKEVVVPDDPVRFQVESRLSALQDAIIDEVARRTLTIRRVHALMELNQWEQARTALDGLRASHAPLQDRLDQARAEALRLAQEGGSETLAPSVKEMLDETQNYIDVLLQPKPLDDLRAEYESRHRAYRTNSSG